jgi:hypothetical protein
MEFVRKRKANAITELREIGARAKLKCPLVLEWRNWHTQQTQNLPPVTRRGGSTPPSSTNTSLQLSHGKVCDTFCLI